MYNFAEIFLKSLFIMRQFTILHLNFVCSHCNLKLYLVKTWDFSMMGQLIKQKRRSMYQISFYLGWDAVLCEKYLLVSPLTELLIFRLQIRDKRNEKKKRKSIENGHMFEFAQY